MATVESLSREQQLRLVGIEQIAMSMRGRSGNPPHPATVRRWITEGYQPPDGEPIYLEAILVSGGWVTLPEWVAEFESARLEAGRRAQPRRKIPTNRSARKAHRLAERELDRAGIRKD